MFRLIGSSVAVLRAIPFDYRLKFCMRIRLKSFSMVFARYRIVWGGSLRDPVRFSFKILRVHPAKIVFDGLCALLRSLWAVRG